MAHTILVRLDVDDEYADIHPDITATDYLEGSKAHGWEVVTERVFTESEVRAMLDEIHGLAQAYWDNAGHGAPDMLSASEVAGIAERGGILLDPA